jgi:hypothetical protein
MRRTIWARTLVAGAALGLLAAVPAGATVTAAPSPLAAVQAASSASFVPQSAFNIGGTQTGTPIGIADSGSTRAPFPRDGSTYLVLSTGNAALADQPDQAGTYPSVDDLGGQIRDRGAGALDVTVMQVTFPHPVGGATGGLIAGCLDFDFRFLSEEYPSRLGAAFNDAFVAEGDNGAAWTTSGPSVLAPENFASSPFGQPLTIDSGAPVAMSPAEAAGTPYGAATGLLHAQILTPAQGIHRLQLSLLDHGDTSIDSAVFIDNVAFNTAAGACPRGLTPLGPAVAITGPAIAATVDTPTPMLTGTAGNATGDASTVAVRIYGGPVPAGAPVQTLSAPRSGNTWSAQTAPLAPGQYTAQATQANGPFNGVSAPTTFTVAQPQGGSSQQQTPGDRDGDGIPDDQDTSDGSLPPIPGKTFDARVISGSVFIKYAPGTGPRAVTPPKGFVPLKGAASIPIGSQLDTRKGHVSVTSAANSDGSKTQAAEFYDAIFQVKQTVPKKKPNKPVALITDLVLKGEPPRSECAPLKGAAAAAATKKKRGAKSVLGSLWGSGKGKFRTNGKYSSATVRGTIWLTQDRCDGTLTTVKRGTVSVRDFKLKKTVSVKAGHSYLARAQRAASKAKRRTK